MGERRGTKALELWCRRVTEGYPGVDVSNMTTSWRDGLAFCALIHRFRPDLIDFESLRPGEARHNNELAFRVAERHLGIPALLDAEDMVDSITPDRLSVLTYLAQFYQAFGQSSLSLSKMSSGRGTSAKCSTEGDNKGTPISPSEEKQTKKVWQLPREPCALCGLPVFLAERLACSGRIFHRPCFKCARCGAQMNPANCYETESHYFCCEVCPDELVVVPESSSDNDSVSVSGSYDEYSTNFETVLETAQPPLSNPSLTAFLCSQLEQADLIVTSTKDLSVISPNDKSNIKTHNSVVNSDVLQTDVVVSDNNEEPTPLNNTDADAKSNSTNDLNKTSINNSSLVSRRKSLFETLIHNEEPTPSKPVNVSRFSLSGDSNLSTTISLSDPKTSKSSDKLTHPIDDTLPVTALQDSTHSLDEKEVGFFNVSLSEADTKCDEEVEISNVAVNERQSFISEKEIPGKPVSSAFEKEESRPSSVTKTNGFVQAEHTCAEDTYDQNLLKAKPVPASRTVLLKKLANETSISVVKENTEKKLTTDGHLEQPSVSIQPVEDYPEDLNPFEEQEEKKQSTNPFGSSDEEEEVKIPTPMKRKVIPVDAYLNPFWEDGQGEEEVAEVKVPVPRPRSYRSTSPAQPSPSPRHSIGSANTSTRKKHPAPPPPPSPAQLSPAATPYGSLRPARKSRPAPRPPGSGSNSPAVETLMQLGEKEMKDELNRTRQGLIAAERVAPEKSHHGQWKRKKGPAPALPIPPRRQVRSSVSPAEVKQELDLIETQQRGLEKQGVRLEEHIREQLAQLGYDSDDASLPVELEDSVLQLFELVNEKNELFRRQAELMYLKRQQRLEEQQADIEWQIRCLLQKPNRTEDDLKREEDLISRLVAIVEQRNQIVDCLEMDRKREADEDVSVRERLQMLSPDRHQQASSENIAEVKSKKKKGKLRLLPKDKSNKSKDKSPSKKEDKKLKSKENPTLSSESDVTDPPKVSPSSSHKKSSKKKWFT